MVATSPATPLLPPDHDLRLVLHNELHARPSARIRLPACVIFIAVLNEGIARADEYAHLKTLPGQGHLTLSDLQNDFLRLRLEDCNLRWERHSEFTRYMLVQPLPSPGPDEVSDDEALFSSLATPDGQAALQASLRIDPAWLAAIPGKTIAAVQLIMTVGDITDPQATLTRAQASFDGRTVVASLLGGGHSLAITDFHLNADGFERMLVVAPAGTGRTRVGRIAQRLLELETYRLMALRGLPVAKDLGSVLAESEGGLADVTARLEARSASEAELLDTLIHVAARVERATAQHMYRFSATQAYDGLVRQRIAELRERPVPGTQTIGDFMLRRLSPAIATVAAASRRLASLSQRIERTGGLLRTRVDVATEKQNNQLLAKLTRGQELQLRLQATVEGLSIAAISYYVVSLLMYAGKSLKAAGVPLNPEIAAGALIPVVLFCVWRITRRIHAGLR